MARVSFTESLNGQVSLFKDNLRTQIPSEIIRGVEEETNEFISQSRRRFKFLN